MSANPYSTQSSPGWGQSGTPNGCTSNDNPSAALRPMKIAQLLKCVHTTDNQWHLDGHIVGKVTVVALVLSISRSAANFSYRIEDGSGTFEVRAWGEGRDDDETQWGGIE
ncbi:hypothetical protein CYLTODRAFT_460611 [Cylindrobasidium torrendii FP15055 ss-10]|uniref:Uncharacterized protein n=1 Tax=Cylindrobasidium torrendii FP15055 ss-10 TaxID=1314674 RepID=A0A0D7ARF8_9AGAR|nr:hypothetical protein CYLTODRAFT_460611 [Cylindrobasidium torrendii FP15055 ss-10]